MEIVVDSNKLQSQELELFLQKRTSNKVVLTDFVAIEAYKGDTLNSVYKSFEIVSNYPSKVIILKSSGLICSMSGRRKGLINRLIDNKQTNKFPRFIDSLLMAKKGSSVLERSILQKGREANDHMSLMEEAAERLKPIIEDVGKQYTKSEKKIIRGSEPYTDEMMRKTVVNLLQTSSYIVIDSPYVQKKPSFTELPNTFYFRLLLSLYFMSIKRYAEGSVPAISPEKLRNDMVDIAIVAYGTYFDGVLSDDTRLNSVFSESCHFLKSINAYLSPRIKIR